MERLRFDALLDRHADGIATSAEADELAALLKANPEFRREFVERTRLEITLHDLLSTQNATARPNGNVKAGRGRKRHASLRKSPWLLPFGIAASILLAIGVYVLWVPQGMKRGQETLARVSAATNAHFSRANRIEPLANANVLVNGDLISTDNDGRVEIDYADGTRVTLESNGRMNVSLSNGAKRVRLLSGEVSASVAKQPAGQAMIIATATAQATIVGTQLRLKDRDGETRLEVTQGLVRLQRSSDGRTVDVAAGQVAVAASGRDLVTEALVKTPESPALVALGTPLLREDFENGRMEGWADGVIVPGGVEGSRYAISASSSDANASPHVDFSAVRLPLVRLPGGTRDNEWIFTVQRGLILQFSFFLEGEAGSIRVQGFDNEQHDNFGVNLEQPAVGRWTTVQLHVDAFLHNDPQRQSEPLKQGTHFRSLQFQAESPSRKPTRFLIDNVILAAPAGTDVPRN